MVIAAGLYIMLGGEEMELSDIKTRDLVQELRRREGVETEVIDPHADVEIPVCGPAIVLVVSD